MYNSGYIAFSDEKKLFYYKTQIQTQSINKLNEVVQKKFE